MRASWTWLVELSGVEASPEEMAARLTGAGLEVEAIEHRGAGLEGVVVAEVRSRSKVEGRDKLTLVRVFDGERELEIVCGAPNVPDVGGKVALARVGASLPSGLAIAARDVGGVRSHGMLCSEVELGIGEGAGGILVLDAPAAAAGAPLAEALGLRDAIFELGLTPNRPDCLGHLGLAREVALLFGASLAPPPCPRPARLSAPAAESPVADGPARFALADHFAPGEAEAVDVGPALSRALGPAARVRVEIADPQGCPRYGASLVAGVRVGPSPFWLRYRLHCLGLRPINNVVDVTNLVVFERGHPIHAFDLSRVRGRRIEVRRARPGERLQTLDGASRELDPGDLLICDGEGPVAVAGVMGGANSEISDATTEVLVECAYFDPRSVRRTSRRLGLHTDASHRFERGVDPGAVREVLARTTQLIADLGGGVAVADALDACPAPIARRAIAMRPARISALLGFETSPVETRRILEGLGCEVEGPPDSLVVRVPTARPDLAREVDLAEEIARVRGYDHIPTIIPRVRPSSQGTPLAIRFARDLRRACAAAGLTEAICLAFVSPRELEVARAPGDRVPLLNPLSEERSVMRTSLLPGLAAAVRHAQRRQVRRVALFEVGRTYHDVGAELPAEPVRAAFLLAGPRDAWIGEGEPYDLYDLKGFVSAVLHGAVGAGAAFALDDALDRDAPFLHPRRRAAVSLAGVPLGAIGELHPEVAEGLELEGRPVFGELRVDALLRAHEALGVPQAAPLPRFPSVSRDIAMLVDERHEAGAIAEALREAAGELVEAVELFDLYRGEQIPTGKRSLAFRVTYRDPDDTLTDRRVDDAHGRLARAAAEAFAAVIR